MTFWDFGGTRITIPSIILFIWIAHAWCTLLAPNRTKILVAASTYHFVYQFHSDIFNQHHCADGYETIAIDYNSSALMVLLLQEST
jgi:hypothetical protein